MNQGGKWSPTVGNPTYQSKCSFNVSEPVGWASVNAKTSNTSATNQMSWFVCPSTYNTTLSWTGTVPGIPIFGGGGTDTPDIYKNLTAQNGSNAMVVRNVAWDENGTTPPAHYKTRGSAYYYSENVPSTPRQSYIESKVVDSHVRPTNNAVDSLPIIHFLSHNSIFFIPLCHRSRSSMDRI